MSSRVSGHEKPWHPLASLHELFLHGAALDTGVIGWLIGRGIAWMMRY